MVRQHPPAVRRCKECGPDVNRPAPHPGPRCVTHHRAAVKARRAVAHEARVQKVYGLAPGAYAALYAAQGGRCAICQRSTGQRKRLAVDHDHRCCPGPVSCGRCVRGLLCGPCNRDVIGRLGPEALSRAYWYLVDPPAQRVVPPAQRVAPSARRVVVSQVQPTG